LAQSLALSSTNSAERRVVFLTNERAEYPLGRAFDVLEDPSLGLSIDSVAAAASSARFRVSTQEAPNFSTSRSAFWVKFTLHNLSSNSVWILESQYPVLDTVELYAPSDTAASGWTRITLGDAVPFSKRDLPYRTCLFRLNVPQGATQTLYMRFVSNGAVIIPCSLWSSEGFLHKTYTERALQGAFFGIMAIMLFYNLFLVVAVRDVSYWYYVLYLASFILYQATLDASAHEYLWGEYVWWSNTAYLLSIAFCTTTASLFARSFLGTRRLPTKLWDRILVVFVVSGCMGVVLPLLVSYRLAYLIVSALVGLASVALLVVAVVVVRTGYKPAQYFLIGWTFLIVSVIMLALNVFNVTTFRLTDWYVNRIAATVEVTLLSLGLAYRVNLLRTEQKRAQMLGQANEELSRLNAELAARNKELLQVNAKLDEANLFKTTMLGMVSHDLKNPLSVITSSAQLLQQSLPEHHADRDIVDAIETSSERMLRLIQDLLDKSAIELGTFHVRHDVVAWSRMVLDAAEHFQIAAATKNQVLDTSGVKPCNTIGDGERLQQVVENLLSNAVKYSRLGGRILVRLYEQDHYAVLEVQDDGPGFTDEDKAKMFGRFQRLSARPTAGEDSSGMGLSIVKNIVEVHGGSISVDSTNGGGATVIVKLLAVQGEE
jgi:signal transduction histidine kinase